MELELAGQAILKNLNVRAEHHGEERVLGVDLRIVLSTDLDALANFSPALKALLYADADDANKRTLRIPSLKPLGISTEFENHCVHIADQSYDGASLSRFEITPELDGKVLVAFTASLSDISPDVLPDLAALYLDEKVNVDIEPLQGKLDLGAAA